MSLFPRDVVLALSAATVFCAGHLVGSASAQTMGNGPPAIGNGPVAGNAPAAPVASSQRLSVELVEGATVHVGQVVRVRVASAVAGAVVVFNEEPDGTTEQLYPSRSFPGSDRDGSLARIDGSRPISVPTAEQWDRGYRFVVRSQLGTSRLYAVVVAPNPSVEAVVRAGFDGATTAGVQATMRRLSDAASGEFASASFTFEVRP